MKKVAIFLVFFLFTTLIHAQQVVYQSYTVTGNETWNLAAYPDGVLIMDTLIIKKNGYLTVNNVEISFAFQASVLVEIGGKLVAYGTSFIPNVAHEYWNGIVVRGNPKYSCYNYSEQGLLYLDNNCFIKGGFKAIITDDGTGTKTGGALIVIKNTTFKDCWPSVEVGASPQGHASIYKSTFISTDEIGLYEYPVAYYDHVPPGILSWHTTASIIECEFISQATLIPWGSYAVGAVGGNVLVKDNTITNWTVGAYGVSFDPTDIIVVQDNEINAFSEGVFLDRQTNSVIVRNDFKIGNNTASHAGYFLSSNNYTFEDNNISNLGNWASRYGIFVQSTGPYINEIYRNSFNNLYTAVKTRYNERTPSGEGLTIKCNQFSNCRFDIFNFQDGTGYGLAEYQGSMANAPDAPAGNEFSYYGIGYSDITNLGSHFNYIFHNSTFKHFEPFFYTSYSITKIPNTGTLAAYDPELSCPSNFPLGGGGSIEPGNEELKSGMIDAKNASDQIKLLISQILDGGNTQEIVSNISGSFPDEAYQVYLELMQLSPYLSNDAIDAAINNETTIPNAMIRDIMVANAHSAKDNALLEKLEMRSTPMSDEMKSEIWAGLDVASALENLESIKSYYDHTASKNYKILLHRYMSDTVNPDQPNEELIDLLSSAGSIESFYHLAFLYLKSGNYTTAESVLSNIPGDFDLSSTQNDEYNAMQMYFNIRKQMHQNGQMVGAATADQLTDLLVIAENDWGMASSYAQSVLFANDMWETIRPPEEEVKSSPAKADEYYRLKAIDKKSNALHIAPCPTSDFIVVKHSSDNMTGYSTLEIHGVNGKLIKRLSVEATSFEKVINVSDLSPGNYVISLINNGKWIESGNFTVVK